MKKEVSIIIISYNSEDTIVETLESVKNQKYKNYEVIISDDGSTDNTIEKVKEWYNRNNKVDCKILANKVNKGVVKNINRGLKKAKGEWIKLIAADDILLPNCLENNIEFVRKNKHINICFSKAKTFGKIEKIIPDEKEVKKFKLSSKKQYEKLKWSNFVASPTCFINRKIFEKYGFFDERIPMMEDLPYWIMLTSKGEKLYFLDKITVGYRIRESLSNNEIRIVNKSLFSTVKLYYKYYLKDDKSLLLWWHYQLEFFIKNILVKIFKNKNNKITNFLLKYYKILDIGYIFQKLNGEYRSE